MLTLQSGSSVYEKHLEPESDIGPVVSNDMIHSSATRRVLGVYAARHFYSE